MTLSNDKRVNAVCRFRKILSGAMLATPIWLFGLCAGSISAQAQTSSSPQTADGTQPVHKKFSDLFKLKRQVTFSADGTAIHTYVTYESTLAQVLADNPNPFASTTRADGGKDVTYREWNAISVAGGPALGPTNIIDFVFAFDSQNVLTNFSMVDKSNDPVAKQQKLEEQQKVAIAQQAEAAKQAAQKPTIQGEFPHTMYYFKTITRIKNAHETCAWPVEARKLSKVDQEMIEFKKMIDDLDYTVNVSADLHGTVEQNGYCFSDEEHSKFNKMLAMVQ